MRTRTKGIQLDPTGERVIDKQYRGHRLFERLGPVSQDEAETQLRQRQASIDRQRDNALRQGAEQLFRLAAGKYLLELKAAADVRTIDTISGHILLLNEWMGDEPLRQVSNDSFTAFKAGRLAGRTVDGKACRAVKPATVNRTLEVARTVLNRAARVWRTDQGLPWLGAAPLIEMLDETATKRPPRPLSWADQAELLPELPAHLQRMVLFAVNTGARDENLCGLKWEWEVQVPEVGRSVFVVPAAEFKSKRAHVLVLNDVAWRIVQEQRGKHTEYVFVYRRERVKNVDDEPAMKYRRVATMNNTGFQAAREAAGLASVRVHDLRHTYGQRLREAGVPEEDRALLLGHAIEGMPQHYATATVARLVELANRVKETDDRVTLLRVVNG
jgi:integrase